VAIGLPSRLESVAPDHHGGAVVVGVLALQGDFEAHVQILEGLGVEAREVRVPHHLEGIDGLLIPGGESTTIMLGLEREALAEPLRDLALAGTPVLGTCAGLIVLDREHLGVLDLTARRNAFGRQAQSFEAELSLEGVEGGPIDAVFIRAPWVEQHGPGVDVLAEVDGHPVAVRQRDVVAVAFHPEMASDDRLHAWLVAQIRGRRRGEERAA
jgi:pyridoxal 5'-phosphate synthase pdxT subunit